MTSRICLIGFGEVGQSARDDLGSAGELSAWDVLFARSRQRSRAARPAPADPHRPQCRRSQVDRRELVISRGHGCRTSGGAAVAAAGIAAGAIYRRS